MEFFFKRNLYSSVQVSSTQYNSVQKGWNYPSHRHHSIEIMYCESGEMSEWIGGQQYRLRAGEAILIHPEAYHYPEAHEDSVFLNFHFEIEPREIHRLFSLIQSPVLSSNNIHTPLLDVRCRFEKLIELFRNTSTDVDIGPMRGPYIFSMLKLQSNLLDFIGDIINHFCFDTGNHPLNDGGIQPFQLQLAHEAASIIQESINDLVHVSQLAERMCLHRNHLTSSFKKVFGISPKQYLIQERTKQSKRILKDSDMTMDDIAERMSFSSTSHFCRFFREQTGQTPYQYRSMENKLKNHKLT